MSASIAHEVNQQLAAIVTNGEAGLRFLSMSPPEIDEVRGALERMVGEGRRAGEIVRRIRVLTRKSGATKGLIQINDVVQDIVPLIRRELAAAHAALALNLDEMLPMIEGDRVQLQQVVLNLVLNAAQALEELETDQRSVQIRSWLDVERGVTVAVSDSGPGISDVNTERLFEPFFTTRAEGTGMGLSICRRIVESHSGRISAANNSGPGATVSFSLPAAVNGLP